MRMHASFGAMILLLVSGGCAAEEIDQRWPADADTLVIVKNVKGEIHVEGWAQDEVHLTGRLGQGSRELDVSRSGNQIRIEVIVPRRGDQAEESVLYLQIPAAASVEAESVSARIEISGLEGRAIRAASVSGDVDVDARSEQLDIETVSGDVELRGRSHRSRLGTVSGDIDAEGVAGELAVNTVSGEVLMRVGAITDGRFESVSGDVEIDGSLAPNGKLAIESLSGDVDLNLPADLSARCTVETFSGSIRSDRGEVRSARHGPHKSLEFLAGDGDGSIRVESFSGTVRIHSRQQ